MLCRELEMSLIIGGEEIRTGNPGKVVMPHEYRHVMANYHMAGKSEMQQAIGAALLV